MTKKKMFFRMISASLIRRRSRMLIALLSVAIGAMILSGLVTIYYDVPRQMGAQFRRYGSNMIVLPRGESFSMEDGDKAKDIIPADSLVGAAPYRYENVRINQTTVLAAGTDMEGAKASSPYWNVDGEWPSESGQLLVGKEVAEKYGLKVGEPVTVTYTPEEVYGGDGGTETEGVSDAAGAASSETEAESETEEEMILDQELDFKVTGILDTGGSEESYIYMSLDDLAQLTGENGGLDILEFSITAQQDQLSEYADQINEKVDTVNARLVKRVAQSEGTVLTKLQALVLLVTIVVLALTMICVATTMTATVTERKMEIGLRKALGASDKSIIQEFMGEGVLLGAIGGLIGAILGFFFAQGVSMGVFNNSIVFRPLLLPITIIASMAVTGLASLIPIRATTKIDPALVLKGE